MKRYEIIAIMIKFITPFTTGDQRHKFIQTAIRTLELEYNITPKEARQAIYLALTQHLTNKSNDSDKN